jgi:hypothetical protein
VLYLLLLGLPSKIYGCLHVLQLANCWYVGKLLTPFTPSYSLTRLAVSNLTCGFAMNKSNLIVFCFLTDFGTAHHCPSAVVYSATSLYYTSTSA